MILINDDESRMDFVKFVLVQVFPVSYDEACRITYTAHYLGRCLVGIFPFVDATERLSEAGFWNMKCHYNLKFEIEIEVENE